MGGALLRPSAWGATANLIEVTHELCILVNWCELGKTHPSTDWYEGYEKSRIPTRMETSNQTGCRIGAFLQVTRKSWMAAKLSHEMVKQYCKKWNFLIESITETKPLKVWFRIWSVAWMLQEKPLCALVGDHYWIPNDCWLIWFRIKHWPSSLQHEEPLPRENWDQALQEWNVRL